jgi:hypothetical protein
MKDQAPTSKHQRNSKRQASNQLRGAEGFGARHSCRFDAQSAGDLEILGVLASRTVKRAEARAPELNGATLALTPALSPRRGRIVRRLSRIPAAGLARLPFAKPKTPNSSPLSPGERAGVRASVTPIFRPCLNSLTSQERQSPIGFARSTWSLKLGASLDVGAWCLELSSA